MATTTLARWLDASHFNPHAISTPYTKLDDVVTLLAVLLCGFAYAAQGTFWNRADPYRHKLFEKPQQRAISSQAAQKSANLAERLDSEDCDIAILWASQSGTAERFAGRLAQELRANFSAKVLSLDISNITPASFADVPNSKVVIILASTFGEGDPSDNMHQTWNWLCGKQEGTLSNLRFVAFGLGNSNYKYYNHVVDVLVEQLLARGANMLMSTGKADDAAGETEEHFLEWKQTIFQLFRTTLNYQQQQVRYEPALEVREDELILAGELWSGIPYVPKAFSTQSKVAPLPIVSCHDLLQGSTDRMCLHIELDTTQHPNLKYKTGDHLAVWPINPTQEIQLLLSALGLERRRKTPIRIKALGSFSPPIPSPTTLEAIFQNYLEICAPVPRESIEALIAYAPTAVARTFLESVSCDKTSYAAYTRSQYLNLGRLFQAACPAPGAWTSVPLSLVIEMLPAMRPRSYSISSSSVVSPRKISITVAVSDTTSVDSPDRVIGVATNYLLNANGGSHPKALTYSKLLENGQVYAAVRKSTFKLPLSSSAPVVMVGAGTGVAPFRAFVQERARLKSVGREVGPTRLFFGCRDRSQDLIYDEDFSRWKGDMSDCFSMTTAFSRPKDGGEKQYVQDAILTDAEAVCKLLVEENAYFYICGSAAMARDVSAAVTAIIMKAQGWDETKMKEFADRQKRQKRWLQDVWG